MERINPVVRGLMISSLLIFLPRMYSKGQTWTGTELAINHATLGDNSDYTAIFRDDSQTDRTHLKIRMGDEYTSDFEIGYQYYVTGQWNTTLKLDGYGNLFIPRSIGIGISGSASQLHLASDTDHEFRMSRSNGMYGFRIFRDALHGRFFFQNTDDNNVWGTRIQIEEGGPSWQNLILNPDGGNVGIGNATPQFKLDVSSLHASVQLRLNRTGSDQGTADLGADSDGLKFWPGGYNGAPKVVFSLNGNVGIGTAVPDAKLAVNGDIHTREVKVDLNGAMAPDYVFEKDYDLLSLDGLESYIAQYKHLPEVPSGPEMEQEGINLKEMNLLLLKKVEELTMYVIEQNKRLEVQESRINAQQEMIQSLSQTLQEVQHK